MKRKRLPRLYTTVKIYGTPCSWGHGGIRFAIGVVASVSPPHYVKIWVSHGFADRQLDGDPKVWYDLRRARVVQIPICAARVHGTQLSA
jgi:hypothetical protein